MFSSLHIPITELATIVHDPTAHHPATPAQLESWDAQRQRGIAHQIREAERRKGEDSRATAAPEAAAQKKRAERDARRRQQLAEAAEVVGGASAPVPVPSSASTDDAPSSSSLRIPSSPQQPSNAAVYTVAVSTTSGAFAWYAPGAHTYETLDAAREAGVWTYPATEEERARCEVFRDLWEKGNYLGGGGKFGGDWLVYPGVCASALAYAGIALTPSLCMQAIRCVIILTLWRPCRPPRLPHYVRWRSWRTVGWARRRKRHICCVDGTR
jgi:tRNA-splicing endonuclease subunit Sen34